MKHGKEFEIRNIKPNDMKTLLLIILCILLIFFCWPVALGMFFLFPLVWLILLPFGIIGLTLAALIKFILFIVLIPFKLIGLA
jgi:hypothetical protein